LPVVRALYDDAELTKQVPVMSLGKHGLPSMLHARPMSPFYSDVSKSVARAFHRTLKGELTGTEATKALEKELRAIVRRNR
jgi:hypothetical protein